MMEQELLLDLTDAYLKTAIAEASESLHPDFDSFAAFGELGINSFQVLKIIKKLEGDFGTLPKSLLFENFNIHDLAKYFVNKHEKTLRVRFAAQLQDTGTPQPAPVVVPVVVETPKPRRVSQPAPAAPAPRVAAPILILEKDALADPELSAIVTALHEQYKLEGCVSRGTRIIAPSLFIGSERRGYFNYSRTKDVVMVYSYTGPRESLPALLEEILRYCTARGLQLNLLADEQIEAIGETRMTTTPFGALQRVGGLQQFTLDGGPMRRLRYQVQKFQKAGPCCTREYRVGSEAETDRDIVRVIDQWCSSRTVVNPLVHVIRAEILEGKIAGDHRLFLTYLGDALQNVILLSPLCAEANGYLMDLEFYPADMPLGGLEFAIVQIIEVLRAEGRDLLSLGGTHGCKLEESPNADPELDRILDELRAQNIFNDAGNLQFKNKFRPDNRTIFLCRPAGSGNAHNVIDIIMMIADPDLAQSAEPAGAAAPVEAPVVEAVVEVQPAAIAEVAVLEGHDRSGVLAEHGFNPLNVPAAQVDFDLKTDSWAQLEMPAIEAQMRHLHGQLQQSINVDESLRAVFPFAHIVLTESGQGAEHVFFRAWPRQGVVVQNLLFPSTIFHQIDNGFTPREVPGAAVFQLDSREPYKGDLSSDALQTAVANDPASIAMVCIEVANNAAGGHPVSMQHLRDVKALLAPHSIPLVLDVTRIVENAQFLVELDPEFAGQSVWAAMREILSCADAVIGSLTKDFCVNKGGLVATNDAKLFERMQQILREEGADVDVLDKRTIALSLRNRKHIEGRVKARVEGVRRIWEALHERNVPVVGPAGGHCLLIDVNQLPELSGFKDPVASFLAWLYLETGIRAGAHSVGMQKQTAINHTVRLAIPVGLKSSDIDAVIARLVALFEAKANIPEIVLESKTPQPFGGVRASYKLLRYHNVRRAEIVEAAAAPVPPAEVPPPISISVESEVEAEAKPRRTQDVAIIGMSGRYPKAKNPRELWANLIAGRDCIEEMPADRYERRVQYGTLERYRGGFIDDVDRFDSLFFNISPREAEMLDPQERLFLEVAWEALEDAGYYPELLAQDDSSRNIGVYVGAVWAMYQILGVEETHRGNKVIPNSFLWSIANRASYALNLSGPSLTVDTACSSSLTALYLAVEAIQSGQCGGAIVGGVNLDLHQTKFDINNQGGALSPDGYCRTFGKGANGYVQGEGIGALYLKPLAQAERDGDHIYGVIRGAVVNHGGRTSGYTVPNPKAQGELIRAALEKAQVDAGSIGYIEAHGTGTELGDPIEITGLNNAFEPFAVGNRSCPIGSVKTNIGHLEAAAGVVSVSKVLLQLQHRRLAPSLHSAELNEFIDFAQSPFYVVREAEEWNAREVNGERLPLRAGISSFGAGGANAHVILEEYVAPRRESAASPGTLIFPLSARNEEQLRDAASRLAEFLRGTDLDLADAAFTLQQGRKSFEQRLAVVARTKDELIEKLATFVAGKKGDGIVAGHAKGGDNVTRLLSRREKQEFLRMLVQGADAQKTAALWAEGLLADWQGFPSAGRRVSLPTYPFADKRHWVPAPSTVRRAIATSAAGAHPMVDTNESTFERQIFRKTFHERDFFIYDHLVSDIPTLPGVAYLEFARKAGELATGRPVRKIKNVLWISPIAVQPGQPKEALIELKPSGDGVQFEVFSEENGKKTPHSQGKLYFATGSVEDETIDLAAIRARVEKVTDGATVYPLFKSFGLNLGPSFQVLQEVWKSDSETLGALQLPQFRHDDLQSMPLHPSLVDGSLQAGVAAQLGGASGEMVVPFSIGEVEIFHPLQPNCFSYVTKGTQEERKGKSSGVLKSNVTIVDETGRVLVRIRESIGVPLREVHKGPAAGTDGFEKLYYSYDWQKAPVTVDDTKAIGPVLVFGVDDSLRTLSERVVMVQPGAGFASLGDDTYTVHPQNKGDFTQLLQSLDVPAESIVFAWPLQRNTIELSLERGIYSFFNLTQALVELKLEAKAQLLYVHDGETQHEAATGFVNSLRLESPKLVVKTLDVRGGKVADAVAAELRLRTQDANAVRYDASERSVRRLQSFSFDETSAAAPIREHGVYVITGGAGGLGLIFADYLVKQHKAKVVLTGRSTLSPEREAKLRELGEDVVYIAADVSDRDGVRRLIDETKTRFGAVNGVIHAAGVLRDSLLRNKTREEMSAVFAPKVYGTLHLDELTQGEDLDFFVTFSSLAAVAGNGGQCDYSYANHFMDSFAAQREQRRAEGKRNGRTISFNWSIWAEGGMKLDEQTEQMFIKTAGIKPLGAAMGIDAFVRGLATERVQIAVLEGLQEKVETMWGLRKKEPVAAVAAAPSASTAGAGGDDLREWLQKELTQIVVALLKVDAADVEQDKVLLDLGFDSIGLTTFANAVNDKFALDITPVLFFDYPSVAEVAKYLAAERESEIRPHFGGGSAAPAVAASVAATEAAPVIEFKKGWTPSEAPREGFAPEQRFLNEPIAVVGMSGVMPQSADLEEFWENLRTSTDMISVIPEDRWSWEEFYGDPLKEANKSNSKWGGFMKEVDKFDPLFFGISPREAQMMDPQQRIFLETVWKAIEDSGQKVSDLSGTKTGLFVGVATNDYADLLREREVALDGYTASGNSHSVLANRVSFLLNLHGPSAPIDTACSSSLVALHRAIESIHTRSCDMAIVGGVQVMLSPAAYISFGAAGMLSSDGKCKTFDKSANGYVRGEGSGAIFLKRLSEAERDGNHIYAVIKATAENHGGKVTTLTAPNSAAQTELLVEAYEKAQVDPATVGYIECHGTGTPLGDPIEIQALSKAFAELYKKRGKGVQSAHCGLSSVKTNIGHLETAAGIAGLLKALLAIQHKQIPANIHFDEVNPYIKLDGTPFYIADKLTPWEAPVVNGAPAPRRAGLSSFGFGGANAHIVLEEYIPAKRVAPANANEPQLIVLSAKNADRLDAYVRSLRGFLDRRPVELIDLAWTLQVGRDEMAERLAVVAASVDDLKAKLDAILAGNLPAEAFRNNVNRKGATPVGADAPLGEQWAAGAKIDWRRLYTAGTPRRISVPTYPFARERYWVPAGGAKKSAATKNIAAVQQLHPLVQRNTSTLQEQKFTSRFTGEEFYLADHVVETHRILPGVAYIEMARVAGELSGNAQVSVIRNVAFERPLVVDAGTDVEVSLTPSEHEIRFAVKSGAGTHCTGKVGYQPVTGEPATLDIAAIRARCSEPVLTGSKLYPALNESGLKLGRSFQIVDTISATESESLAVLRLPEHLADDAGRFWLHPALMDGSLHTAMGLVLAGGMDDSLALPYSVAEVQIFHPLTDLHYGYATWSGDPKANPNFRKVDFHLLDKDGKVLVRIKDFVSRPLQTAAPKQETALQSFVPSLVPASIDRIAVEETTSIALLGGNEQAFNWLRASYLNARTVDAAGLAHCYFDQLLWIAPEASADRLVEQQEEGVIAVFRAVKTLLDAGYANRKLQWTLVVRNAQSPAHAGVAGLIGSMAKEYPQWDVRLVDVESLDAVTARECLTLPFDKQGNALVHRDGAWLREELTPMAALPASSPVYREHGVYVVIGGAGGVGEVWSRFMIENYGAQIVWIGRRALDASIQQKIDALAKIGPAPLYVAADATDAASLERARSTILETHPAIHGVVHSAIVLKDQSLARMDEATFRAGLSAKVDVSVNLDRVFGALGLDFVLFFSSIVSFFKTPGQSNYAAGCTFKDAFARSLGQQRAYAVKTMNWGYWGSVGVVADEEHNKRMAQVGLGSIEPEEGMAALQLLAGSSLAQAALIKTVEKAKPAPAVAKPAAAVAVAAPRNEQRVREHVRRLISETMSDAVQIDAARIGGDTPFSELGVDSIAGIRFLRLINEALQIELEATSLFEYSTVEQLTGHILGAWGTQIAAQLAPAAAEAVAVAAPVAAAPAPIASRFAEAPVVTRVESVRESRDLGFEPIAVVGMSGRFAESESLDEFWQNLAGGKHLASKVSRWNASDCAMSEAKPYCSHGSFVDSIDRFDPAFFGISPEEAVYMDPQQRLFLEESWKALEDAGHAGKRAQETQCGVYVGCGSSNYDNLLTEEVPAEAFWGNSQAVIPARIAYYLDLQGPAIAVDTACSSSLVAVHLACQGLWARETEMALAGGVFLQATPEFYQVANQAGMLSPDGRTRSFDAHADGFVPGEGVGVVVLKRLSDALRDGDTIHGVIAGSGINQDGRSNGFIAPNGRAQERLERAVYDRFAIDPATIQVVEAHATGSVLGDSIEYGAMTRSFREYTDQTQFCALGTVKTNIGHAAAAAGVASLLKLLLALKHEQIPPSLHFEQASPVLDLASGPFYVNTELKAWETNGRAPRRAAINSFGFSGTNAHLVLEEAPARRQPTGEQPAYLVTLSARSAAQLQQQAQNLLDHVKRTPDVSMSDLSFSLFAGRMHLTHRLACAVRNAEELVRALEQGQVCTGEIPQGRVREQAALKKFGNYCIRECGNAADAAAYAENLTAIADLYVQGYALDYDVLFAPDAKRIPLPTYPFADERYWIDADGEAIAPATTTIVETVALPVAGGEGLEDELAQLARTILGVEDELALDKVLLDLGFDSMGLTQFADAINAKYELKLTPVVFFDYPSLGALADYLAKAGRTTGFSPSRTTGFSPSGRAEARPTSVKVAAKPARKRRAPKNEPIAIVGISGVLPQSPDLDAFWQNLKDAKDLVTVIPRDRWKWEEHFGDPFREPNKTSSKWGGFIGDVDKFDPRFFGISPREAEMMDPQQRLFLEAVWKAVENSGQKVSDLAGTKTGVFAGVSGSDYTEVLRSVSTAIDGYSASGNVHSILANRVSFLLDLHGPSEPVDTACSASLIALHRAVESIHSGSCDMALAGGVQINLVPGPYIAFSSAGMLSTDGKCKTFDKGANGYVRGEGVGAIFLKRLSDAERDGNPIYGIVRSTAENHGGRVSTLTAPNSAAQSALLIDAYEKADIDPATVGYIECHGTGTSLGDPIEAQALSTAFAELYRRRNKVPAAAHTGLASVKTNIGHLEAAAGVAGVFKVLLAMQHRQLPANVHFEELNPYINFESTPFYIVDKLTPWTSPEGTPRRAGISSFGFGGANAHVVIEEYVAPARNAAASNEPRLIVLSAKNAERLDAYVASMNAWLAKHDVDLTDFAFTLQAGRDEMPERLAFVASSVEELKRKFATLDGVVRGSVKKKSRHIETTEERDLTKLAGLWVGGAKVDWSRLYTNATPRRIAAPTYPFARERHWPAVDVTPEVAEGMRLQSWVPVWTRANVEAKASADARVLVAGNDLEWVRQSYPNAELLQLDAIDDDLRDREFDHLLWIADDSDGVLPLFRIAKALLRCGYNGKNLQWTAVTTLTQRVSDDDVVRPANGGVSGFMGSLAKEYPQWDVRTIDVDSLASVTARECLGVPADKQGNVLARRGEAWFRQELSRIDGPAEEAPLYRENGVYVVIGGAGGIGEVWTRSMIERHRANVVWIGRRAVDATIQQKIDALAKLGPAPLYVQADATSFESLQQAYETIRETHPVIHGVVHSAVVLREQSIARTEESELRAGYAAKADVSVNMDRVFGGGQLDFMLFFSSMASFFKTPGVAAYSAGCTFKDSFAQSIQQQRAYPVRTMNWGYWGSVGVAANEAQAQLMSQMGVGSIEPEEGMAALQALAGSRVPQLLLIKMQESAATAGMSLAEAMSQHVAEKMRARKSGGGQAILPVPPGTDRQDCLSSAAVRRFILDKLAETLKMDPASIPTDESFPDFGVDSIAGVTLVRTLNEELNVDLEPSKLFENDTVDLLSQYIASTWQRLPIARTPQPAEADVLDDVLWHEESLADEFETVSF